MGNSTKIIHIITGLDVGGAEQMLKRLLLSDPESKTRVIVISLTGLGVIGEQLQSLGYTVYALNFGRFTSVPTHFFALIQLIRKNKPAIVQTWMYHADCVGGLAARMAGCTQVIWGIRNTFVPKNNKKTYWLMRLCALLSYLVPKKIVCVAHAAKAKHASYGYRAKKMLVIPNGFDFSAFDVEQIEKQKVRKELGIGASDFIIGCVGRLHLDKGQDILITAAAFLEKLHDKHIYFMLVGRGCDNNNSELLAQIDSLGLSESFILLGERHDIPHCLAAMDAFCMPSRTEGFPNGLGEAMCMGLPCVATQAGDTKVLTGDTAILVAPDDPMALAAGLAKMIGMSAEQRQELGARAALRVRSQFSIDKTREQFMTLYREMAELSD